MTNFNNASIQELNLGEMDMVGGGTDWEVVATGLMMGVGAVAAGAASVVPGANALTIPIAGALGTAAVHTIAAGLAMDD